MLASLLPEIVCISIFVGESTRFRVGGLGATLSKSKLAEVIQPLVEIVSLNLILILALVTSTLSSSVCEFQIVETVFSPTAGISILFN